MQKAAQLLPYQVSVMNDRSLPLYLLSHADLDLHILGPGGSYHNAASHDGTYEIKELVAPTAGTSWGALRPTLHPSAPPRRRHHLSDPGALQLQLQEDPKSLVLRLLLSSNLRPDGASAHRVVSTGSLASRMGCGPEIPQQSLKLVGYSASMRFRSDGASVFSPYRLRRPPSS
jgi:hypothetical protein